MQELSPGKLSLSSSTVSWLLEGDPSVRYSTHNELLSREHGPEAQSAKQEIGKKGWAAHILEKQKEGTYWENPESCYIPKWTSSGWQLPVLADLGVPGNDPRIKNAVNHYFSKHNVETGGFSFKAKDPVGFKPHVCLTGNMVRALARFGYAKDERVVKAMEWLVSQQLPDGGWNCFAEDGAKHGSFQATHEPLWALGEMLKSNSRPHWSNAAKEGSEFLLKHKVFKSSENDEPVLLEFHSIHYPLHSRYDFLQGLRVLSELEAKHDDRMDEALNLLQRKRSSDGRWNLEGVIRGWRTGTSVHGGKTGARPEEREVLTEGWGTGHTLQLEEAGKPSRWITLQALLVLKRLGLLGTTEI